MLSEDEKAIQFYKRFIEAEEQELEWMYKEDEEYYRDSIEQKELLIKGWRNILNLITKLQKENKDIQIRKNNQEKRFKKYKKNIDKQHEEIYENLVSEKEKYKYLYQKALDNTITADKENIQLKKQIDLMADTLQDNLYLTPLDGLNKKEIKSYFEKLAKEKGK